MRVFQNFSFDLGSKILFKDTLPFVEKVLEKNGFTYESMVFSASLSCEPELIDKIINKYPSLEKYKRINTGNWEIVPEGLRQWNEYLQRYEIRPFAYDISSVPQYWHEPDEIHVQKEDEVYVRELITKIPRPYNPGGSCLVLDHVKWFPETDKTPASNKRTDLPSCYGAWGYSTNHIELVKDFAMGRKHNIVRVKIESTNNFEKLKDVSSIIKKLSDAFGEAEPGFIPQIIFDSKEKKKNEASIKKFIPIFDNIIEELNPKDSLPKDVPPEYVITKNSLTGIDTMTRMPFEHISPKKSILKAIKGTGYTYAFRPGGIYECEKINANNHRFELSFSQKSMSRSMEFGIRLMGYNFDFNIPFGPAVDVMKQSVVEEIVNAVVNTALKAEELLTNTLLQIFGRTPDWYFVK